MGALVSTFRKEKQFNKVFFNRVFAQGTVGCTGIGDFYELFTIAIDENDIKLVTRVKQCFDA